MDTAQPNSKASPPPAQGVRLPWETVPAQVRAAVERWLGSPIVSADSQPGGFSPGVAARLRTADGRGIFVKAVGREPNPDTPFIHRREAHITALLPAAAPVPRLLWSYDDSDTGWVVLVFEEVVDGQSPAQPWNPDELSRVLDALITLSKALTPSPLPAGSVETASETFDLRISGWRQMWAEREAYLPCLDDWSARHLEQLAILEAGIKSSVAGDTLLHLDLRADNMLLTPDRVWIVDWPHASVGAAWTDIVLFAPSVAMQSGPSPEELLMRHPACQEADPRDISTAIASLAGYFIHRSLQPPPPGIPTVRAFQAAQGVITREWLAQRIGWT